MITARIKAKDSHWRIEDVATGLCVRLHAEPSLADDAPRIVARLAPGPVATWFVQRAQAVEACARYLVGQPVEIVRVDA